MTTDYIDHAPSCPRWRHERAETCGCRTATTSWADGPLCAFDLETTGPDPETARIVTATVIRIRPGQPIAVTNWLTDVGGEEIPAEAAEIHGITTEHARAHGRPLAEAVDEIRVAIDLEWSAGIPVVGHNVSYDLTVLARECDRVGMATPFTVTGPVIDTIVLDRGVDRYRRGKRTLTAACEVYGIELSEEDTHSSSADALAAARVAWKIAKAYPEIGGMSLRDLYIWQKAQYREWADNFGAYLTRQGKTDDVSRDWPMRSAS